MRKKYQKNSYQENTKTQIEYQKTKNKENPELHKNIKNELSVMSRKQEK